MFSGKTEISNVLIIGCGGAGLRAAIEVKKKDLSVRVLGKRKKEDSHTVLAAGGINAALGNLDPDDSWENHFLDTYIEGYFLGDPKMIEIMAQNSPERVYEIDQWGANLDKLKNGLLNQRYFGAHSFRRTCFSGDYTGSSILNTLIKKANQLKIPVIDTQYVTDLLIKDKTCFGAFSFDIETGERTINYADAVILCTGGHTRIWKKSSSRKNENTGDGLSLGLKAGCDLIDMEMVQFHPTGMLLPEDKAGTLVTEAVRGEGGILLNLTGERFMKRYDPKRLELSTRDKVAIANYTEIIEGRGTKNGGVYLDISHKSKNFILEKLPSIYEQFIEFQNLDISEDPMEVSPTAHYSMGGILASAEDHSTNIAGLFAAGEVVGGLHGANRLGGNSLAEILVFGKIAGEAAVNFSRNLNSRIRSNECLFECNENINNKFQKGKYLSSNLQNELADIMWEYCGVVRNKNKLNDGLQKIKKLKELSKKVKVDVSTGDYKDLVNIFNLDASIISAEATIKSALYREESRGAHQREDFKEIKSNYNFNTKINLSDNGLNLSKIKFSELTSSLKEKFNSIRVIENFSGRLLE